MQKVLCSFFFVFVAGAACTATGSARYSASATMPTMVYVSPGVQVIEDYDEPVFYSSNVYWRYSGGVWYQSRVYTGGWVRVSTPPAAIVRIERPSMYVHYRASARGRAQANANPTPAQQERREEKREIQQERREEKREDKQERREDKQERREDKQERREDKQDSHDNGHKGKK
jgi:hypothetical protein